MNVVFEGVSARLGGKPILQEVSFSAEAGALTALIGRNGAGKSTLLSCLSGQLRPSHGRILLGGQDLSRLSRRQRAQLCAVMPQALPKPSVPVQTLVGFGRTPYVGLDGRLKETDHQAVRRAIRAVGLEAFAERSVAELSGGERRKAFFAMALAQDTPVVALDEPTAHLDLATRFSLLDCINGLTRTSGKAFLVVLHELPEVLRCADRIVVLHQGQVVFDGTAAECLAEEIPQRYFQVVISGSAETGFAARPFNHR